MRRNGDKNEPSNTFILTFSAPTPPPFVRASYMRIPVELFVPNPLRCFKCQRYGHGRSSCQRPAVCARCGSGDYEDTDCHATPHCTNCGGSHTSYSKDCPEWSKRKAITQVKFERNIPFGEAKEIVQKLYVSGDATMSGDSVSYAKATASSLKVSPKVHTQTMEIQTDLTWPTNSDMPILLFATVDVQTDTLINSVLGLASGGLAATTKHASAIAAAQTKVLGDSAQAASGGRPQPPAAAGSHLGARGSKSSALAPPPTAKLKPRPASSKTPLEKPPAKTAMKTSPTRPPKGSGDLVKLANKYSSLDEIAMDLGGASSFSPNKGKHK